MLFHRDFFAQLKGFAEEKGYRDGWASNKYRDAVGVWPNAHRGVSGTKPSWSVRSWIKSQQIAFAKRNGSQNAGGAHV